MAHLHEALQLRQPLQLVMLSREGGVFVSNYLRDAARIYHTGVSEAVLAEIENLDPYAILFNWDGTYVDSPEEAEEVWSWIAQTAEQQTRSGRHVLGWTDAASPS